MSGQHPNLFLAEGSNSGLDGAFSASDTESLESPFHGALRRAKDLCESSSSSSSWSSSSSSSDQTRKEELMDALKVYDQAELLATNDDQKVEVEVLRSCCQVRLALELHACKEHSGFVTEQLLHSLRSQKRAVELGWCDELQIKEACIHTWNVLKEQIKDLEEEERLDILKRSHENLTTIKQRSECLVTIACIHLNQAMETLAEGENTRQEMAMLTDTRHRLRHAVPVAQKALQELEHALGPEVMEAIHPDLRGEE